MQNYSKSHSASESLPSSPQAQKLHQEPLIATWFRDCIGSRALTQYGSKEATLTRDGQKHALHKDCDYSSLFTCKSSKSHGLSSFTKVLPRWQTQSAHLLLCSCWLEAFTSFTGGWPWLRQWLLSCTCFFKHTSWETTAYQPIALPPLQKISHSPHRQWTGGRIPVQGHFSGNEVLQAIMQSQRSKSLTGSSTHVMLVSILRHQISLFCYGTEEQWAK